MKNNNVLYTERTIETLSGHYIDVFAPNPDHIDIRDIASGLAKQSRWSGQTEHFYSVGQHSLWMVRHASPEFKLECLLHDATEAYLGDMPSPIKRQLPGYIAAEKTLDACIRAKFGLPYTMSPEVKSLDKKALEWEWDTIKNRNAVNTIEDIQTIEETIIMAFNQFYGNEIYKPANA